jgi:hypothetical protein
MVTCEICDCRWELQNPPAEISIGFIPLLHTIIHIIPLSGSSLPSALLPTALSQQQQQQLPDTINCLKETILVSLKQNRQYNLQLHIYYTTASY